MTRHHRHFPEGGRAMMRTMTILGVGLIGLMHPTASHAGPLDFMFSFSNTVGNVNGTVTGEIFGLTDNATGPASNVVVDGYPAGLGLPTPPITVFMMQNPNIFTVSNATVTAADFLAVAVPSVLLRLNWSALGINELSHQTTTGDQATFNEEGFAGVTYTPVSVPAPLLATGRVAASVTLLATGLATLWPLRRRLRRRAASA
jgi:hypothetical protein